ncbi:MAG: hypothetical protein AB7T31_00755 [Gemmatimonadales bacterium]
MTARAILVLACVCAWACGDAQPESGSRPEPAPPPAAQPGGVIDAPAPQSTRDCVGPGSTAEEVRALLGEPDSVMGGWWHYGRTQFHLGSGTIQDYVNGGNVPIC